MNNNKVIITGGLGFIGSNLIKSLLRRKFHIYNFDKLSKQSSLKFFFYKDKNYNFKKIDLSKISNNKLTKIIKIINPRFIINLASETHVDRSIDSPEEIIRSNIISLTNLLVSVKNLDYRKEKIKFIHLGTDEIFGDIPFKSKKKFKEDSPIMPNNPYSASKASQIHIIKAFCHTYKLKYIIINPSNNYGPYQFPEKFIPKSIMKIFSNKPVEIYGKGKNIRNWIYVEDTVEAIIKIMRVGRLNNIYNISSSNLISNNNLIKKIFKHMNIKNVNIKYVFDRPGHDEKYSSDSQKLKNLGWKEKYSFDQGITKTISWYLKNENLKQFCSKKINLKRLGKIKK